MLCSLPLALSLALCLALHMERRRSLRQALRDDQPGQDQRFILWLLNGHTIVIITLTLNPEQRVRYMTFGVGLSDSVVYMSGRSPSLEPQTICAVADGCRRAL